MKHLRKFNESVEIEDDIQIFCNSVLKFCKDNLVFLFDKWIEVDVEYNDESGAYEVFIYKSGMKEFYWEDVRYDIIPFLIIVDEKYNLIGNINNFYNNPEGKKISMYNSFSNRSRRTKWYSIDEIKNNNTDFLEKLTSIQFNIRK